MTGPQDHVTGTAVQLLMFGTADGEPEQAAPAAEKLVVGRPVTRTWNLVEDGAGLFAGLWEATPGAWRIDYTEWEFCHILSGVSVLTAEDGTARQVGPGDSFVIPRGFKGTWAVIETTRKHYVIKE